MIVNINVRVQALK